MLIYIQLLFSHSLWDPIISSKQYLQSEVLFSLVDRGHRDNRKTEKCVQPLSIHSFHKGSMKSTSITSGCLHFMSLDSFEFYSSSINLRQR